MCGIVGFVNFAAQLDQDRKKWITHALLVDQLRGMDSTGIAMLPKRYPNDKNAPALKSYKKALAASDFIQMERAQNILKDADVCRFIMGHNRYATTGSKDNDNFAHPFLYKEVTAIHNGTLTNRIGLRHTHVVDSAAIAMELAELQPEEYPAMLGDLRGAYTLVWYNAVNNHVYFARNDERPLVFCRGFDGDTLFFASEEWMIEWVMGRLDPNALDYSKKGVIDMWEMPKDMLHAIDLSKDDLEIVTTKYKGWVEPPKVVNKHQPAKNNMGFYGNGGGYGSNAYPYDDVPFNQGKSANMGPITTPIILPAPEKCPYKVGDPLHADTWDYVPNEQKKQKGGKIVGEAYDWPEVTFVVPNVTKHKYEKLHKEWMEWTEAIEEEPESKENESDIEQIFLVGEVTCVSPGKNRESWVVNIKPKSVVVEFVVTPLEEQIEDIEEELPEKQPQARSTTKGSGILNAAFSWNIAGRACTLNEWLLAVKDGCFNCSDSLFRQHHDAIVWHSSIVDEKEVLVPICGTCHGILRKSDYKNMGFKT